MKNEKDVQIVHALPGRVRLKVHRLKHNIAYAADIQRHLLEVPGITHLEANPQTGSLLILYDPSVLEVLALHPSVSACLGLTLSELKGQSAKGQSATMKTARKVSQKKVSSKMQEKSKPKKNSSKISKGS